MHDADARPSFALLEHAQRREAPFSHFVAGRSFMPAVADAAHAWLDSRAPWRRHVSSFFDQFECSMLDMNLPPLVEQGLVSPATLVALRRRIEALFGVVLADVYAVVAHRLVPGQGIGVHTDRPLSGTETHRMVVHLGPGFRDRNGGHLLFFASKDPSDLVCGFRSIHNSAVGFELTSHSHHAVTELDAGVRYTLVYSFWRADCGDEIEPPGVRLADLSWRRVAQRDTRRAPHAIAGDSLARTIQPLVAAGAARARGSEPGVLPDLVHTYELLRDWGCADDVCLAGLYHGVYGNSEAAQPLISVSERARVRDAIGRRAERLVHAGCAAKLDSLTRALADGEPGHVSDRRGGNSLGLDHDAMASLALVCLANRFAQRWHAQDEDSVGEARLYELAKPHLEPQVQRALQRVYERP